MWWHKTTDFETRLTFDRPRYFVNQIFQCEIKHSLQWLSFWQCFWWGRGGGVQIFHGICHKCSIRCFTRAPCCSTRCSRSPHCSPSTGRCSGRPSPSGSPPPTPPSASPGATTIRRRRPTSSGWSRWTWWSATWWSRRSRERSVACTSPCSTGTGVVARSSREVQRPGLKYVRIRIWSSQDSVW